VIDDWNSLDRRSISTRELENVKYDLQFFRSQAAKQLIAGVEKSSNPKHYRQVIRSLDRLRVYLDESKLRRLIRALPYSADHSLDDFLYRSTLEELAILTAHQGEPHFISSILDRIDLSPALRRKGPLERFNPFGTQKNWVLEQWTTDQRFSVYDFQEDGGLIFRGITFYPGDVVLVDQAQGSSGIFAASTEGGGYMAHLGFVIFFEKKGQIYPAVVDASGDGNRATPLNVFLYPEENSYYEIYRHQDAHQRTRQDWENATRQFLSEDPAFDLHFGEHPGGVYCTSAYQKILERLALPQIELVSAVDHRLRPSLERVGVFQQEILSPIDIIKSENFQFVSSLDNGHWQKNFVSQLLLNRMMGAFEGRELQLSLLPHPFSLDRFLIQSIQSQTALGRLMSGLAGFDKRPFPLGRPEVIALIKLKIQALDQEAKKRSRLLISQWNSRLSFEDFVNSTEVQESLSAFRDHIRSWTVPVID